MPDYDIFIKGLIIGCSRVGKNSILQCETVAPGETNNKFPYYNPGSTSNFQVKKYHLSNGKSIEGQWWCCSAVAADNDGTDAGDYTYSKKIVLSPSEISWNVYPNVSDSKFNFLCSGIPIDLKIYNTSGEKVFQKKNIEPGALILELNNPSGVYFISVVQNGKTSLQKIVIKK